MNRLIWLWSVVIANILISRGYFENCTVKIISYITDLQNTDNLIADYCPINSHHLKPRHVD